MSSDELGSNVAPSHYYALPIGTRLHEFEIEGVLGAGGFGITYKARDCNLDHPVAIKEFLPGELAVRASDSTVRAKSSSDGGVFEAGLAAFLNEARVLARFQHPNITRVRRYFEMHGTAYLVLQYEAGQTLAEALDVSEPDGTDVRDLLLAVLDGLEAVHDRGILHRDLKPNNIILRHDGTPVMIDFGAARDFTARHSRSVTAIIAPGYSPPEQYGTGGEQGPWTDFYALGAIAYRCVTGETPPDSLRRLDLLRRSKGDLIVPAREAARAADDPALLRSIDWMLRVDEAARPQSVAELREAIEGGTIAEVPQKRLVLTIVNELDTGMILRANNDAGSLLEVAFRSTPPGRFLKTPAVPDARTAPPVPAAWSQARVAIQLHAVKDVANENGTSYRVPDAVTASFPANAKVEIVDERDVTVAEFVARAIDVPPPKTAVWPWALAAVALLVGLGLAIVSLQNPPSPPPQQAAEGVGPPPSTDVQPAAPDQDTAAAPQAQPEAPREEPIASPPSPEPAPTRQGQQDGSAQVVQPSERKCDRLSAFRFDEDRPEGAPFTDFLSSLSNDAVDAAITTCVVTAAQPGANRRFHVQAGRLLAERAVRRARVGDTDAAAVDMRNALKFWNAAEQQGSAYAINLIGTYKGGSFNQEGQYQFVVPDQSAAVDAWRRAMEAGNVSGKRNYAAHLLSGIGVSQDIDEALRLLNEAADSGDGQAAGILGAAYYTAIPSGVKMNKAKGWALLKKAPCEHSQSQKLIRNEIRLRHQTDVGISSCPRQ